MGARTAVVGEQRALALARAPDRRTGKLRTSAKLVTKPCGGEDLGDSSEIPNSKRWRRQMIDAGGAAHAGSQNTHADAARPQELPRGQPQGGAVQGMSWAASRDAGFDQDEGSEHPTRRG